MSPGSLFKSMSYTSSRSMHYLSPLCSSSHQTSTPFTFSYFGRSRFYVSHRSYYMNHVKIYPFSDILCPQWAIGAILYQRHVLLTVQYAMCPHWAPGLHTSSSCTSSHSGCSGSRWAVGVIVWTMSKSSNFQKFCVHNEYWEAFYINGRYI